MAAFLPTPPPIPLNVPGSRSTALRPPLHSRPWRPHAARIHVSATTDEVLAVGNLRAGADQNGVPPPPASSDDLSAASAELGSPASAPTTPAASSSSSSSSSSPSTTSTTSSSSPPQLAKPPTLAPPPTLSSPPARRSPSDRRPAAPRRADAAESGAEAPGSSGDGEGGAGPDGKSATYTRCGNCSAVYEMDAKTLGRGRKVQCSVCQNTWFQRGDRLLVLKADSEKFIDYPVDKKDEMIEKAAESRRNRRPRDLDGAAGERRQFYNRDGGRQSGERAAAGERRGRNFSSNSGGGGGGRRSQYSIFIGNLPFKITEDELRAVLAAVLPGERVTLMKDQETGRSRGFAFCDCKSEEDVEKAVSMLDGVQVSGRALQVRPGRKNTR